MRHKWHGGPAHNRVQQNNSPAGESSDSESSAGSPPPLESATDGEYVVSDTETDPNVRFYDGEYIIVSDTEPAAAVPIAAVPIEATVANEAAAVPLEAPVDSPVDDPNTGVTFASKSKFVKFAGKTSITKLSEIHDGEYVVSSDSEVEDYDADVEDLPCDPESTESAVSSAAAAVPSIASSKSEDFKNNAKRTSKTKRRTHKIKHRRRERTVTRGYQSGKEPEDEHSLPQPTFVPHSFPAQPTSPELVMNHFELPPVFANPMPAQVRHYLQDNSQTIHAIGQRRRALTLRLRMMKELHDRDNHLISLLMYNPAPEDLGMQYHAKMQSQINENRDVLNDPHAIKAMYNRRSGYSQRRRKLYDELDVLAEQLQKELLHRHALTQIEGVTEIIPQSPSQTENSSSAQLVPPTNTDNSSSGAKI